MKHSILILLLAAFAGGRVLAQDTCTMQLPYFEDFSSFPDDASSGALGHPCWPVSNNYGATRDIGGDGYGDDYCLRSRVRTPVGCATQPFIKR